MSRTFRDNLWSAGARTIVGHTERLVPTFAAWGARLRRPSPERVEPLMATDQPGPNCPLCQLAASFREGQLSPGDPAVVYADDDLLGLVPAGRPGVLVAPRAHISVLFGDPALVAAEYPATVLAALRRVAEEVKSLYGADEVSVEPATDGSASGHLCYYVAPVVPAGVAALPIDPAIRATRLAGSLGRPGTGRAGPPPDPDSP